MKKVLLFLIILSLIFLPTSYAALWLKADTAQRVVIGPFVDVTDGLTPELGIQLPAADEKAIIKYNAITSQAIVISGNTWGSIGNMDGYYNLTLSIGDLDTEGMLTVVIQDDSICLPVFSTFMVVNASLYDTLFTSGGSAIAADVTKVAGNAVVDNNDGRLEVNVEEIADSAVSTSSAQLGVNVVSITDDAITAASSAGNLKVNVVEFSGSSVSTSSAQVGTNVVTITDDAITTASTAGTLEVNIVEYNGASVAATVSGLPDVNVTYWEDAAITDSDANPGVDIVSIGDDTITDAATAGTLQVNVVEFSGSSLSTSSAQIGANVVSIDDDAITVASTAGSLNVNVVEYNGSSMTATVSGLPDVNVTYWEDGAVSDADSQPDVDVVSIGANVITATSIQADAITDAKLAADVDTLVNDEVADVLKTDTVSEMSKGAPSATPTMEDMLNYIYRALRNKIITNASSVSYYDDAGSTILFRTLISDDGTFFIRGELITGP